MNQTTANKRRLTWILYLILPLVALAPTGCNVFDPFDNPSGDDQLLSAARACFDHGEFDCAREKYQQVSNSNADVRQSEEAFVSLNQSGASLGAFIAAFGTSGDINGGDALTTLANRMVTDAGETKRLRIFAAYQQVAGIQNKELRGLVRFVSSLALAAEILAEVSATPGNLKKSDLVLDATACGSASTTVSNCSSSRASVCTVPASDKLPTEASGGIPLAIDLDTATVDDLSSTPSLNMLNAALNKVLFALNSELEAAGGLSQSSVSFLNRALQGSMEISGGIDSPCFRWALISNGIGGN